MLAGEPGNRMIKGVGQTLHQKAIRREQHKQMQEHGHRIRWVP